MPCSLYTYELTLALLRTVPHVLFRTYILCLRCEVFSLSPRTVVLPSQTLFKWPSIVHKPTLSPYLRLARRSLVHTTFGVQPYGLMQQNPVVARSRTLSHSKAVSFTIASHSDGIHSQGASCSLFVRDELSVRFGEGTSGMGRDRARRKEAEAAHSLLSSDTGLNASDVASRPVAVVRPVKRPAACLQEIFVCGRKPSAGTVTE